MGQRVTIKQAAKITGLTEYALRKGAKQGKYPHIRVGSESGKYLFDIDLLDDCLNQEALNNTNLQNNHINNEVINYGKLRYINE